jgi:hypothetical protein
LLVDRAESAAEAATGDTEALLGEAEGEWRRAMALAEERGHPVHGLRAAVGYARYLGRQGRSGEAAPMLRDQLGRCPEGATTPVLVAAANALADLEQEAAGG